MRYKTRNALYLRISINAVLPMTLLIDYRHLEWMSDEILSRVLFNLKDRIQIKLDQDKAQGKTKGKHFDIYHGNVRKSDTHEAIPYTMLYYFRQTPQKHAVLLKDKQLIFDSPPPAPALLPSQEMPPPPMRRQSDMHAQSDMVDGPDIKPEDDEAAAMDAVRDVPIEADDEKPDSKPKLSVSYTGFSIFHKTLVVIVQPTNGYIAPEKPVKTEDRQLTEEPDLARSRSLSAFDRSRSISGTPAPPSNAFPLFRSVTPGGSDSERGTPF
ncbi:uncharacterized protein L969DRAFT_94661 [Mixia osmundae IAM 14324]|uniref:Uncharacterized protein n=1 Tax=Mixia osmundae (strain CBS 9802 / IAM 14324 / JCM 22182 / KY 12970) TaxID=764103 RepID=G7DVV1_MIXOS|nr:uncharacterized protein L969DRAFT_94661 [Mixia osmundae IAM 14324]KEI39610.1 hypothetical protein L969DRAFT_94661 [Mixia osmundae IAM 14324]GAA94711.1 hypothetical protein E5Q_01364 [Mixia osmundae IAM 14324]